VLEGKITQLKGELEKAQEKYRLAENRASNIESVLKKQLIDLIASHEHQIETSLAALSQRLSEREADLTAVKKLFVDKLRELESSFVELDQNLIDTEAAQQEAARKAKNNRDLEQSLEHVIGHIDDDHDEQIDQLVGLNEQLAEENRELREQVRDLQRDNDMEHVREQFQELHDACS